jgi:hypothetical protein
MMQMISACLIVLFAPLISDPRVGVPPPQRAEVVRQEKAIAASPFGEILKEKIERLQKEGWRLAGPGASFDLLDVDKNEVEDLLFVVKEPIALTGKLKEEGDWEKGDLVWNNPSGIEASLIPGESLRARIQRERVRSLGGWYRLAINLWSERAPKKAPPRHTVWHYYYAYDLANVNLVQHEFFVLY